MKRKIAVTGGIGSGKSTVMELLKKWGYGVFSCDQIYRNLLLEKSYIEKLQKFNLNFITYLPFPSERKEIPYYKCNYIKDTCLSDGNYIQSK